MTIIITRKYCINQITTFLKYSACSNITRHYVSCGSHKDLSSTIQSLHITSHITVRRKSYFKHKYSVEVEAAVNKQIQCEEQAAQEYLNMAVAFLHPCQSRPGAGGFFMRMFNEEIGHMQDFIQYQMLRGGTPLISELKAPKSNMNITLLEAFQQALAMEKANTVLLEDIVRVAESAKDYQCADFVISVFLEEQMRSINEMARHVTKLSRLCDEHAMHNYDLELVKKYPWEHNR